MNDADSILPEPIPIATESHSNLSSHDPSCTNSAASDDPAGQTEAMATAYHEAGHAVMALYLGRPIQKVTIAAGQSDIGRQHLGMCHIKKGRTRASKDWLEDEVLILLAGLVAEARWTGRYGTSGALQDLRQVRRFVATRADGPRQIERLERRLLNKTEHHFDDPGLWRAVEQIAAELVRCQTISGRNARHVFEQAQSQCK